MISDFQELVLKVLENIPTHREQHKSPDDIASSVAATLNISKETAVGATKSIIVFLDLFHVLEWDNNFCRVSGQIQDYFCRSLSWYIANQQPLLSNWGRTGTAREIKVTNLLETAPYFLKAMEERRLEINKDKNIDPGYSRCQPVAILLIKGVSRKKSYLLYQWDIRAEQYQLIGGRQRPNENILETAKRELQEEIGQQELVFGRDYGITQLTEKPLKALEVSRTYGALTCYEFWLYRVELKVDNLHLSELDKWIDLEEVRKGVTKLGRRVGYPQHFRMFDANIPGGVEKLPSSINIDQTVNYLDFVEIKPSLFGIIRVDIKGIFQKLWAKMRGKD